MVCKIEGCGKKVLAKGLCVKHYTRLRNHGDPTKVFVEQIHGATPEERFFAYVQKGEGCWEWQGWRDANGYGRLNIKNRPVLAHRLSWSIHFHEITASEHVLHKCDNPRCVNPEHLFLGDQSANNADMVSKGRFRPGISVGEKHGCSKLTAEDIKAIRTSDQSPSKIAERYGMSRRQIRDIISRKSWKHLP